MIDALSEEGIVPDADTFKCDIEFKDVKFNYPTRPDTEVISQFLSFSLHVYIY